MSLGAFGSNTYSIYLSVIDHCDIVGFISPEIIYKARIIKEKNMDLYVLNLGQWVRALRPWSSLLKMHPEVVQRPHSLGFTNILAE